MSEPPPSLESEAFPTTSRRSPFRAMLLITAGAMGLYLFMRWLPTGTNLTHMDFRVQEKGAIEFCDPTNPQFIPVIAAKSPVRLTLTPATSPAQGKTVDFVLRLTTASGKPIGPADLMVVHTERLHLLVTDPTLNDYQHIHPRPGSEPGEWLFSLQPQRVGVYRVFADFTPAATPRGLYASADFTVPGEVARVSRNTNTTYQNAGYNFDLTLPRYFRAGVPAELRFRITRWGTNPAPIQLEPIMGAWAHLVAFDEARSGFAHLHPKETDLAKPLSPTQPEMTFQITIPQPGRYVIWGQCVPDGRESYAAFWIEVLP